jgi:hypothetical protein
MMTNSWSFLFDELNMSNQDFWEHDGFSMIGNPGATSEDTISFSSNTDTISFINTTISGGNGFDTIHCYGANDILAGQYVGDGFYGGIGSDTITFNLNMDTSKKSYRYKYGEEEILKELTEYIASTYKQHYSTGDDKIQTLDLIEACGDGEAFCRSNILKYASRYDKKGTARRDIMKILHYAVLLMHFNDKNSQRETYPQ